MSWQRRLAELAAAGGLALTSAGCPAVIPGGTCNANPDPCCSQPDGPACTAQMACIAQPTVTCCQSVQTFDNACTPATCDPLADNDFDGAGPLTKTGNACGSDPAIGCYGPTLQGLHFAETASWKCDEATGGVSASGCAPGSISALLGSTVECLPLCAPGEAYLDNPGAQQPLGVSPHTCSANQHCVYSWRFEVDIDGVLTRSPTSDTVGVCIDDAKLMYDSDGDTYLDTPWPDCATQPLHAQTGSMVPDATTMGCVKSTTAGL